jgi:DNA-binding MarR family transcriptional regulator
MLCYRQRVAAMRTRKSSVGVEELARAVTTIVMWSTSNEVQQETMRRAKCSVPQGGLWLLARMAKCEPVRLSDLASTLGVDSSTLTPQAQRLEREGMIAREPDPNDGRAAFLRLTRAGRGLLARLHSTRCAMFDELLTEWSERDLAAAATVLTRLAERLVTSTNGAEDAASPRCAKGHGAETSKATR